MRLLFSFSICIQFNDPDFDLLSFNAVIFMYVAPEALCRFIRLGNMLPSNIGFNFSSFYDPAVKRLKCKKIEFATC